MKRENINRKKNGKNAWFLVGGILAVALLVFISTIIIYGKQKKENLDLGKTKNVTEYMQNSTNTTATEEVNMQMGKNINEVKKETEKIAINTSIMEKNEVETNKIEETKSQTNTTNTTKSTNQKTTSKETSEQELKEQDPVFTKPVDGEIIKEYGKDNLVYSQTLSEWTTHLGVDIKAEKTTVVKSSEQGTVKSIKNDPRYGLTVVIEHANGFTTVYSNLLTAEFVVVGEKVTKGQTIGTVGNTASFEIADESHLHFEILKDNIQVDPNIYLK